ncbi:hypothetical protein HPB49_015346 [Dermacentor silvarum]|uniref:Uncharacterized protein n=1 Tax=Dermacentor silvarum TaxID=543639 RepID=A0ACB8CG15_DERSI|nr:hypothetical protein HPB49_015346 [Dermacentor silvarum]
MKIIPTPDPGPMSALGPPPAPSAPSRPPGPMSTAAAKAAAPVAARAPNEPPVSLATAGPVVAPYPAYPQGANVASGPNAGIAHPNAGLYFPPHFCFLPPGNTAVAEGIRHAPHATAAVPTFAAAGPSAPAAAAHGNNQHPTAVQAPSALVAAAAAALSGVPENPPASFGTAAPVAAPCPVQPQGVNVAPGANLGTAYPPRFNFAPPYQAPVGTGNAHRPVAQAPPVVAAGTSSPGASCGTRRSFYAQACRATAKKPAAVSSRRKASQKRETDSGDTTTSGGSSTASSSVTTSLSQEVTAGSSCDDEDGEWAGKKDLLKMMRTCNLPQPPPECGDRRRRLVTTLMGVAVLVAALAVTACLLAVLKDSWKQAVTDGETNANSTNQEPQSRFGLLEGVAENSIEEYDLMPNEYGPLQRSQTGPDDF